MGEHRALVVTRPTAARVEVSGATLRVQDVVAALEEGGHPADVVQHVPRTGSWCTAVAVSYASAGHVAALRRLAPRVWLDAMDSWLLVNGSGLRHGHPSYAARALRDGWRLSRMPPVEMATWISGADRRSDRGTVRAAQRLVLPGRVELPALQSSGERRAVVVGDWGYPPNRDGLSWLAREVLPHTAARVHLYGRDAPRLGPQVHLHGYVPDPAELHRTGDVHLGPVRFGAGVKRKVLQPLLLGLPVVSTTAGAHGLRRHALLDVHDDGRAFAAALDRRLAQEADPRPPDPAELRDADDTGQLVRWLRSCGVAQPGGRSSTSS